MSTKKTSRPSMNMEDLMKLRTSTAGNHLEPAEFDDLLTEMIDLKKKVVQQESLISSLEQDAASDPLTNLANRRTLEKELERSLASARRYDRTHALLMIDINNFKSINDQLGHTMGDTVLVHVANLLRQNTRPTDVIARFGGDEFCVILNEIKMSSNGTARARGIEEIIRQTPCVGEKSSVQVEASVGCYVFGRDDEIDQIVAAADADMYQQKEQQKNSGGPANA